jgi:hypothetical protein
MALVELKQLDLNTIRTKGKEAYQRYKTFTARQAEKARSNWMEGLINEQQRNENEDRYRQQPAEHHAPKTKKRMPRQPQASADILQQMVL